MVCISKLGAAQQVSLQLAQERLQRDLLPPPPPPVLLSSARCGENVWGSRGEHSLTSSSCEKVQLEPRMRPKAQAARSGGWKCSDMRVLSTFKLAQTLPPPDGLSRSLSQPLKEPAKTTASLVGLEHSAGPLPKQVAPPAGWQFDAGSTSPTTVRPAGCGGPRHMGRRAGTSAQLPRPASAGVLRARICQALESENSETWRRRVLSRGRDPAARQESIIEWVEQVMAYADEELRSDRANLGDTTCFHGPSLSHVFPAVEEHCSARRKATTPSQVSDDGSPNSRKDSKRLTHRGIMMNVARTEKAQRRTPPQLASPRDLTPLSAKSAEIVPDVAAEETHIADVSKLEHVFEEFADSKEILRDQLASALEMLEGRRSVDEWIDQIVDSNFHGRSVLDKDDFIEFAQLYCAQHRDFMLTLFQEVDTDGSGEVSPDEVVQLLRLRGIVIQEGSLEEVFRKATGSTKRTPRDIDFEEFIQVYDLVQERAGFSEDELEKIQRAWRRYDQDDNGTLDVEEISASLRWQGFAVDREALNAIISEVNSRETGLNQKDYLNVIRKYRDAEVRKIIRVCHGDDHSSDLVPEEELHRLLVELGYTTASPQVVQETASLVLLASRSLRISEDQSGHTRTYLKAAGQRAGLAFDMLYRFMGMFREAMGFLQEEKAELDEAFQLFAREQDGSTSFAGNSDHSCDESDEALACIEAELNLVQLCCAVRWLGYPVHLWKVREVLDSLGMCGGHNVNKDEFLQVMVSLRRNETLCVQECLDEASERDDDFEEEPERPRSSSKPSSLKGNVASARDKLRSRVMEQQAAVARGSSRGSLSTGGRQTKRASPLPASRLRTVLVRLGYSVTQSELVGLQRELAERVWDGKDVWHVAHLVRIHRENVREVMKQQFGFLVTETPKLRSFFDSFLDRPEDNVLKGRNLALCLETLFPRSVTERNEQQKVSKFLAKVHKKQKGSLPGVLTSIAFPEFLHLMRLRLNTWATQKIQEEKEAMRETSFLSWEIAEFRIIYNRAALAELDSRASLREMGLMALEFTTVPSLSYIEVEKMMISVAGACGEKLRKTLKVILRSVDAEEKGALNFGEFLLAVRKIMEENWHNINLEAKRIAALQAQSHAWSA
eukprot:TRINITY_DN22630_c0_g1_i1.p1 TRINITY_DN22630_c0_g1~~TRINITY_DN22630_c0_g1_i1.p1  ORF type:complete len:1119 (-),score=250.16 TRINITY_DN22630_c0_g1_i1:49-3405(-)